MEMYYLSNNTFANQYGENGEKLSDQDVLDYIEGDSYMMAKHILSVVRVGSLI